MNPLALLLVLLTLHSQPTKHTDALPGAMIEVSGYCSEPEPLRVAVEYSVSGPADKQTDMDRALRFSEAMQEFMTVPNERTGIPFCSHVPIPVQVALLFPALAPVPISATEEVQVWGAWFAEGGGKLYTTMVNPRSDI